MATGKDCQESRGLSGINSRCGTTTGGTYTAVVGSTRRKHCKATVDSLVLEAVPICIGWLVIKVSVERYNSLVELQG